MGEPPKPVMQLLYIDLAARDNTEPRRIHLGFRSGPAFLREYLREIEPLGVNHVALNLRFNETPIDTTLRRLAEELLSDFS